MRGLRDIEVAGAVTILGSFAQIIHDQAPGELSHVADPNILERLAALPIDYKAVVALAAAYAVKSGVARMVHAERLNEDMATGQTAGLFGRERLAIVDANERRGQHWRQRLGRGAAFAASGFLAYKGTEHASTEHIMNASLGSLAMGMAGAHYARYRAKQFLKRQKEASAAPCRRRASDRHR